MTLYWMTEYYPPGGGHFGSQVKAPTKRKAQAACRKRGFGEKLMDAMPVKRPFFGDVACSTLLRRRKVSPVDVMHAACWQGFLALKSGTLTADEVLGDHGAVHDTVHALIRLRLTKEDDPLLPTPWQMAKRWEAIEARLPGFAP